MGTRVRWAQVWGLLIFAVAAFFPGHASLEHPAGLLPLARAEAAAAARAETPAHLLAEAARRDLEQGRPGARLWEVRRWYPFGLAPLWLLALLLAALWPRLRALVGGSLLVLALGLALFEACYLGVEYAPLLPEVLGRGEVLLVWGGVVLVLFARRVVDRAPGAVEAHVAAQALLGWFHLLTLPATEARTWWAAHPVVDVVSTLATNFRPAFWVALAGLLLAFLPIYLRRTAPRPIATPASSR